MNLSESPVLPRFSAVAPRSVPMGRHGRVQQQAVPRQAIGVRDQHQLAEVVDIDIRRRHDRRLFLVLHLHPRLGDAGEGR